MNNLELDCQSVGRNVSLPMWMWGVLGDIAKADPTGGKISQVVRDRLVVGPEFQERIAQSLAPGR